MTGKVASCPAEIYIWELFEILAEKRGLLEFLRRASDCFRNIAELLQMTESKFFVILFHSAVILCRTLTVFRSGSGGHWYRAKVHTRTVPPPKGFFPVCIRETSGSASFVFIPTKRYNRGCA